MNENIVNTNEPQTEDGKNWTVIVFQIPITEDKLLWCKILQKFRNMELMHYTIRQHTTKYIYISMRIFDTDVQSEIEQNLMLVASPYKFVSYLIDPWGQDLKIENDPEIAKLPEKEQYWGYYNMWIGKNGRDERRTWENCDILHQLSGIALDSYATMDIIEVTHLLSNMLGLTEHVKCKVANSEERSLFRPILGVSYSKLDGTESGVYYHENWKNENAMIEYLKLCFEFMEKKNKKD